MIRRETIRKSSREVSELSEHSELSDIIVVLGKAPKVRQTTDGGVTPRNKRINKTKP